MQTLTIGQQLRGRRAVLRLTQHQVASKAKVARETVSRAESDMVHDALVVQRIAEAMGCEVVVSLVVLE